MKVNYDFYTGEDTYCDGEIEKDIIDYLKVYGEEGYKEIFENDISWPVFYHITPIRKNILNWYPFKKNSDVLEIGAGMGAITGILCDKAKSVTAVELSKQRASAIEERCKNKKNLEIIVGNFNDIKFEKKFDYITLIGVLEYASLYTSTEQPYKDFLDYIKSLLKEDGKLLIAIENQFGMKYFSGVAEDHTGKKYDGILGYENKNGIRTFGKEELKQILKQSGFKYTKFYYPMPDYKLPNIIFSDEYLPTQDSIKEYSPYLSDENAEVQYDEKEAYKEIIKNKKFDFFANSFFIEASCNEIETNVNLENQELIKIDESMLNFYKEHYKIKNSINTEQKNSIKIDDNKLKKIRNNIISWYPTEKHTDMLIINSDIDVFNEQQNRKKLNITKIKDLKSKEKLDKYDLIFIGNIDKEKNLLEKAIQFSRMHLKQNGVILFSANNKYGLENQNYNSIKKEHSYYSKKEIEKILKSLNISKFKYYYPLPNCNLPNVIFTDKQLPDKESITRDLTIFNEDEILTTDEIKKYKEIINEDPNLFPFFANSFLVEINNEENGIEFVSFNNSRKEEYRIKTIVTDTQAYKKANIESKQHFNNIKNNIDILRKININLLDTYQENIIYSKIMSENKQFDKILIDKFENNEEEAIKFIEKFIFTINEKLLPYKKEGQTVFEKYGIEVDKETENKFDYTKYGFFDLIFQNCFYEKGEFFFYDQEWIEYNLPVQFIAYRAIEYLAVSSSKVDKDNIFEKLKLTQFIDLFQVLEEKIQDTIKDPIIWQAHAENRTTVKNIYDSKIHYRNIYSLEKEKVEKNMKKIEELKHRISELEDELRGIKNSRSWKMMEPVRKIRRTLK
ncbi:MAG: methyltransferase domain-containing protein [Clostridia bacterium]|nr:methyltransferase domain-containing protein [Clostridia bacterium]MBR3255735.1 methyltransferase domain-containing protein [Clostridia bacterium]